MPKKKADYIEVDSTPAPTFSTRADIESGLADFLAEVASCCGNRFELTLARSAERQAADALTAFEKKRKGYADTRTGLIATVTNPVTGRTDRTSVTIGMVEGWLGDSEALAKTYQTAGIILTLLVRYGNRNTDILNTRATFRADNLTAATMMLHSPTTTYSYEVAPLLGRYRCRCVTEADRDFLYRHLRKNGPRGHEVVYWMGLDHAIAIPRAERTGEIPEGDPEFWRAFDDENDVKISEILKAIEATAYNFEQAKPTHENGLPLSFDDALLRIAPQSLLRYAVLTKRLRNEVGEDGKTTSRFDAYLCEVQLGTMDRSSKREKWRTALSKSLLYDLEMSEIQYAPQFSNTLGEGLVCIPLAGENADGTQWAIDASGTSGKHRAERGESVPDLPSEFNRFFFGERGDLCIFQSDPKMSMLRLADFLFRVLIEKTQCRQCLVLAGAGKDGKSVLVKIINSVLGIEETTLNAERLDDPAATYNVINAPLIVMPEVKRPSEVFKSGFFKSLTGGDTMQLRKLFHMAIDWTPEHSRLMMTTNNAVYVGGDAQVSRCLPIAMQKAYDPRTARSESDIISSCLTQKLQFLQWICDTRAYYQALRTPNGDKTGLFMPDRLMVITDEDFEDIMRCDKSLLDMSERDRRLTERRAMEATGTGRFFVSFGEEAGDDEAEWYELLFNAILEPAKDESIARADLATALIAAVEPDRTTKMPRCPEVKHAVDALGISTAHLLRDKAFSAFKAWLESEGKATLTRTHGNFRYKGVRLKPLTPTADDDPI